MDYTWILDLTEMVNKTTIFTATIVGAKSLAITFILLQVLGFLLQGADSGAEPPKIGNILNLAGFAFLIVSSDWIVGAIEGIFAGVDLNVKLPELPPSDGIKKYMLALENGVDEMDVFDKMSFYISNLPLYLTIGLMEFLYQILTVLDIAIVGMYLIQRLFLIQLFKFLFPFAIAFSTFKGSDMLFRWIKIYFGLFVLAIAYTGIIKFSGVIFTFIQNKSALSFQQINYDTDLRQVFAYTVGALLISFLVKMSLFSIVTREVRGFFN
ncbi:hypothetical protein [Chryseobacterium sp. SL1]|uniref:hypothetical protein n=1 Tax=Chryseobacterium sp. SL1 TaxID=2995159 RepID=UPI0022738838|nr:hypothetical protein [Chryseobacterium sp. SL1]MCY1659312.1 hypothetical protein [Chryseobacterium sp. SL1]